MNSSPTPPLPLNRKSRPRALVLNPRVCDLGRTQFSPPFPRPLHPPPPPPPPQPHPPAPPPPRGSLRWEEKTNRADGLGHIDLFGDGGSQSAGLERGADVGDGPELHLGLRLNWETRRWWARISISVWAMESDGEPVFRFHGKKKKIERDSWVGDNNI